MSKPDNNRSERNPHNKWLAVIAQATAERALHSDLPTCAPIALRANTVHYGSEGGH